MGYGHAERNLALIRQLEAETRALLGTLDQPDPEQSAWLQEATSRSPLQARAVTAGERQPALGLLAPATGRRAGPVDVQTVLADAPAPPRGWYGAATCRASSSRCCSTPPTASPCDPSADGAPLPLVTKLGVRSRAQVRTILADIQPGDA